MTINAIQDAIKALAQALNVATIFPATLFVLVHVYWILPQIWPEVDFLSIPAFAYSVSVTMILSYTLYAFNFPLIRVIEGYKGENVPFFKDILKELKTEKQKEYKQLDDEIFNCHNSFPQMPDAIIAEKESCMERDFPSDIDSVLATRVGNTIAAFEHHPWVRYKMDSTVLWPRLVPILHKTKYLDFVIQEKTVFDFLLNMFVVVIFLGLEIFYLSLFWGVDYWITALISLVVTLVASLVFYEGLVIAARQWGTTVRIAFDLYRDDLSQELGLKPAPNFPQERRQWEEISNFMVSRYNNEEFDGFVAQTERLQRKYREENELSHEPQSEGEQKGTA